MTHCRLQSIIVRAACLFALCASLFAIAVAQTATATLSGTVVDPNGAVVPGANITVTETATGLQRTATTNDEGYFTIPLLKPSSYTLLVAHQGFTTAEVRDLVLNVNDNRALRIPLKTGDINETVNITGEAPLINDSPAVATTIDRTFVGNLPLNGRSFQSLIFLTPGVAIANDPAASDPGQFSVNGQRANANYFTVDGVSANIGISAFGGSTSQAGTVPGLTAFGGTNNLVSIDALEEFKLQTSSYSAEFGRQPGGQVQLVTRSGANDFHGTLFEYFRNDALDARNYFNKKPAPQTALRQNQFGGTFSGPVFFPKVGEGGPAWYNGRDRTFFFFSYEGQRVRLPINGIINVPSVRLRQVAAPSVRPLLSAFPLPTGPELLNAAGQPRGFAPFNFGVSDPNTMDSASLRIDHVLSKKTTIFARFNDSSSERISHLSRLTTPAQVFASTRTLTLGATSALTEQLSNELRFNYSRQREKRSNIMEAFAGATPIDLLAITSGYSGDGTRRTQVQFNFNGVISNFDLGEIGDSYQRQINLVDNVSFVKGRHQLKFGIDYRRLFPQINPPEYSQLPISFRSEADVISGTITSATIVATQSYRPIFTNLSAYAHDNWKVSSRFSLALGLRWELNPPPREASGKNPPVLSDIDNLATATLVSPDAPLYKTDYTAFAPRLGAAYQLRRKPGWETMLRGGFGVYYDLGSGQASTPFGGVPFVARTRLARVAYPIVPALAAPPPFPTLTFPLNADLAVSDPDLKLPYTLHWNVALEQALATNQFISVSYVATAGRRLLFTQQRNISPDFSFINPNFNVVFVTRNGTTSDYHSLQAQYRAHWKRGLQALINYTWAHAIDEVSNEINSFDLQRGNSSFDVRHNFSAAATYDVPAPRSRVLRSILRNWSLDAIVRAQSGRPVDVSAGAFVTPNGDFIFVRPDVISGVPLYISDPTVPGGRRFNSAAFSLPPDNPNLPGFPARQGTLDRNVLRELSLYQVDIALGRRFDITERLKLQLKAEAFNVLNHPSFANYDNFYFPGSTTFGVPSATLNSALLGLSALYQIGGPRSIQLSIKLSF